jgi:protein-disulfide isomerase
MLKVPVSPEDHIQGNDDAPLTLLEYGDYECPYCGMAYPIVKRLQKELGDRLRFVFRNFPLVDAHPHSGIAALTAEFAATKGKFWEMHDLLYENQQALELSDLLSYAKTLGLSTSELQTAIENEAYAERIQNDFMGGVRSGVNGTPSFFINGNRFNGSFEYDNLLRALKDALPGNLEI